MTKRQGWNPKAASPAPPGGSGEGDPTVHVSSDMLAGSPDVFAPGKAVPVESSEMTADVKPEDEPAPVAEAASAFDESQSTEAPAEPAAAEAAITPPPPPPPPPPSYQPPPPSFVAPGPSQRP